jgi:hypothetical protein
MKTRCVLYEVGGNVFEKKLIRTYYFKGRYKSETNNTRQAESTIILGCPNANYTEEGQGDKIYK